MSGKFQYLRKWTVTASNAVAGGADRQSVATMEWDVAGAGSFACEAPVFVEYAGADPVHYSYQLDRGSYRTGARFLNLQTRCRKCASCLRAKCAMWRIRALHEMSIADRTWFGTLTVRPEQMKEYQLQAAERLKQGGTIFHKLPQGERFQEVVKQITPTITRWLKRVRKESMETSRQRERIRDGCNKPASRNCACHPASNYSGGMRYLLVVEEHTGGGEMHGSPHFHLLLHEASETLKIRKAMLERQWLDGISHFRLVGADSRDGSKAANYVTKYLTKSILSRARASQWYGRPAR